MVLFGVRDSYKHDSVFHFDACRDCRRLGWLHSYNVYQFIHLYFIPVVPVGHERRIDACPNCKAVFEASYPNWKKKREELLPLLQTARGVGVRHVDVDKLLDLLLFAGTREEFEKIAAGAEAFVGSDPRGLSKLARLHGLFGNRDAATRLATKADIALDDASPGYFGELKKVAAANLERPASPRTAVEVAPLLILPILLVLAMAGFVFAATNATPNVTAVNGLDTDYELVIGGDTVSVPAREIVPVAMKYGMNEVTIVGPGPLQESTFEVDLQQSIFRRLGDRDAFVLNADRSALLFKQKVWYYDVDDMPDVGKPHEYEYFAGEHSYRFRGMDHAFVEPYESIDLRSDGPEPRVYLNYASDAAVADVAQVLVGMDRVQPAIDILYSAIQRNPGDLNALYTWSALVDADTAYTFIESRLDERPLDVNWHREFQDVARRVGKDSHSRYAEYLANDPDNSDLKYLLGRVTKAPDVALSLFEAAAQGPRPSAFGYHGMAFHHFVRGDFARAVDAERRAVELDPTFMDSIDDMLLANRNLDELITTTRRRIESEGLDWTSADRLMLYLGLQADTAGARAFISDNLGMPEEYEDVDIRSTLSYVLADHAAGLGDVERYKQYIGSASGGRAIFETALLNGDLQLAASVLDTVSSDGGLSHLLLYSFASKWGNDELAEQELADAITEMEGKAGQYRAVAAILRDGLTGQIDEIYHNVGRPEILKVIFTAMGFRVPTEQAAYHDIARRLNYDPTYPGLALSQIL